MRPIKILTDSCGDLNDELLAKYDIDYARMNTVYHDVQSVASLSWEKISPHDFYQTMRNGERTTTTQVPVEEFNRIFRLYLDKGMDIVYVGCSLKQSGSVNTGIVVAKELLKEYPDATIYCVNSLNATVGEGILAIYAAELVKAGKDIDTVYNEAMKKRNNVNQFATVASLDWLKKSGRVTASKAFFGNLFGVKPVLISDADGVQTPIKKAKGRLASIKMIVDSLKDVITDSENQTVYIGHADCSEEDLNLLKDLIKKEIPCRDIYTLYIGPIVGACVGPDTIGVWAFGNEVTYRVNQGN